MRPCACSSATSRSRSSSARASSPSPKVAGSCSWRARRASARRRCCEPSALRFRAGTRVLLGACDPLSTPRPLGPVVDVADASGPRVGSLIREAGPRVRGAGHAAGGAATGAGRHRPRAGRPALGRRSDARRAPIRRPTHRIDHGAADRVNVPRRRGGAPASAARRRGRPGDLTGGRPAAAAAAVGRGRAASWPRGPELDPTELHERTGGNPFYVTEVVAGTPARIPPTVRDAVLARAARLSAKGRETLEAAAVIGPTVEHALLARVLDAPASEECLSSGLLQTDGRRYAFRHELARQAILEATEPARRAELHARVLAELESGPAADRSPAVLAHHADEAGDRDAALRYARAAAADASAVGAHRQAAAQLERAGRHAGELPAAERAALLEELGTEQGVIARYDLAIEGYEHALELWRESGDVRGEVQTLSRLATTFILAGRNADGRGDVPPVPRAVRADPGRAREGPGDGRAGVHPDAGPGQRRGDRARPAGHRDGSAGGRAGERARSDAGTRPGAQHRRRLEAPARRPRRSRASSRRASRLAREHGLDSSVATGYGNIASSLGEVYQFELAEPAFEAGLAVDDRARPRRHQRLSRDLARAVAPAPRPLGGGGHDRRRPYSRGRRTPRSRE